MEWMRAAVLLLSLSGGLVAGRAARAGEDWGYVSVRDGANLFWWLYPAAGNSSAPLVLWLQGGPGGSSCGYGNFEEIGPLDVDLKPREFTWAGGVNLLFVDSPVGAGFSYTTDSGAFARNLSTAARDTVFLLDALFRSKPLLQEVPFYIFAESYGGKLAAAIGLELVKAAPRRVKCRLAGVALGDSWISPLDSVLSWGPYLHSTSLLDDLGLAEVSAAAAKVQAAVEGGDYLTATRLWAETESIVERCTDGVNFYNILNGRKAAVSEDDGVSDGVSASPGLVHGAPLVALFQRHVRPLQADRLAALMNGPIRAKLKVIPDFVQWGAQSEQVFANMEGDFMKPVTGVVDRLLDAGVNVTVYNGQLDLIVDTLGQEAWVRGLTWRGLPGYLQQRWRPLYTRSRPSTTAAFYKQHQNLAFLWVLRAGHMVPADQGEMALQMLRLVTDTRH